MICPECGGKIITLDTRHNREDNETYRKRKCVVCGIICYSVEFQAEYDDEFDKAWKKTWKDRGGKKKKGE